MNAFFKKSLWNHHLASYFGDDCLTSLGWICLGLNVLYQKLGSKQKNLKCPKKSLFLTKKKVPRKSLRKIPIPDPTSPTPSRHCGPEKNLGVGRNPRKRRRRNSPRKTPKAPPPTGLDIERKRGVKHWTKKWMNPFYFYTILNKLTHLIFLDVFF